MGKEKETEIAPADLNPQMAALIQALSSSIAGITPQKEIVEGSPEYRARQEAEGWFDSFEKPLYQNAFEAEARGLSKEVRYRAARLKPGKYIKTPQNPMGRVTVEVDNQGVHLLYPVKGDNLMLNQTFWKDLPDMINQIWAEMQLVSA